MDLEHSEHIRQIRSMGYDLTLSSAHFKNSVKSGCVTLLGDLKTI